MGKSNLVLLQPVENVESDASKRVKDGIKRINEARDIMRKKMSKSDCDVVAMSLFLGALEVALHSFDLQPCEINKLFGE